MPSSIDERVAEMSPVVRDWRLPPQGAAHIIQGNALNLPLPDGSVDLICTSPPYFGLRSYQDGGVHYAGQIGSETTPAEFLDALIAATREMVRVLKPSGSIFVNLGDKYSGSTSGGRNKDFNERWHGDGNSGKKAQETSQTATPAVRGFPTKSLLGMPWRYAIACIDQLGLILRAEIIWSKPNGLPESVTDRVRRSHETWFHFTVQPRYFSAVDEIREEHTYPSDSGRVIGSKYANDATGNITSGIRNLNPLGKLPGSVWTIPTQPLTVPEHLGIDHFAAYPMEWPRRIIQGWTPNGICTACGEGRRPVSDVEYVRSQNDYPGRTDRNPDNHRDNTALPFGSGASRLTTITGYACGCFDKPLPLADTTGTPPLTIWEPPPTRPAVVLDPFGGTGTTALVAKALGRTGITVDLSADYCRLAEWRCNNPRELAAALQVKKPEPVHPDQLDLFNDTEV